jgi:protein-serine/threonine kinase
MTYCAGGAFFNMLQRMPNKCLMEAHARFYAAEVLSGLEYLHVLGFIYRDLKPENVLVHHTGHVMLTDFDLSKHCVVSAAKAIEQRLQFATTEPATLSQSFVGTPEYMAPEVVSGSGFHTSAVDWWTFGVLLYEMIYGCTPFRGKDIDDTFSHILQHTLVFPTPHCYPVSDACKDLITKLLHPDFKKRLGFKRGACEIKAHKFFAGVNWNTLGYQRPPFIPTVEQLDPNNMVPMRPQDDHPAYTEVLASPMPGTNPAAMDPTFRAFTELINEES